MRRKNNNDAWPLWDSLCLETIVIFTIPLGTVSVAETSHFPCKAVVPNLFVSKAHQQGLRIRILFINITNIFYSQFLLDKIFLS